MPGELDLGAQFAAFLHAPIPYIAEAVLVAGVVWAVSRAFSKDTIEALRERLNLAADRLQKANKEAEEVRKRLGASQALLGGNVPTSQVQAVTGAARDSIAELVGANEVALTSILAPIRTRFSIPSGARWATPISTRGKASRPDAER